MEQFFFLVLLGCCSSSDVYSRPLVGVWGHVADYGGGLPHISAVASRSCTLFEGVSEQSEYVSIFDFRPYPRNAAFLDQTFIVGE